MFKFLTGRDRKLEQAVAPAPQIGATFGPWADHAPGCKCNVCG